jgi:signal peptidase I
LRADAPELPRGSTVRRLRNEDCATDVDKLLKTASSSVEILIVNVFNQRTEARASGWLHAIRMAVVIGVTCVFAGLTLAVMTLHLAVKPVLTGSMRPAYGPGALLVTREVPVQRLRPGMIILFVPPGEHTEFAHRITSVNGPSSDPVVTTKGDANHAPDPWHAQLMTRTVPDVVATVPWVGRLMVGIRGPLQLLLIIAGGLCMAIAGTRWILYPRRPSSTSIA